MSALVFAFPLVVWCGVWYFVSWLSGWGRLAKEYGASAKPEGRYFRMQSIRMGIANYGNCVTIGVTPEGLYLSVLALFRLAHGPLLIPWADIHDPVEKKFLWMHFTCVSIRKPAIATLTLPQRILDEAKIMLEETMNRSN